MAREHTDLIEAAKAAPDIETALEHVFSTLTARWNDVAARNDGGKGLAMGKQLGEDKTALVDAILAHDRVFKPVPGKPAQARAEKLSGTPKAAYRPMTEDEWAALTPQQQKDLADRKPVIAGTPKTAFTPEPESKPFAPVANS